MVFANPVELERYPAQIGFPVNFALMIVLRLPLETVPYVL